jgi:hypothetical protein
MTCCHSIIPGWDKKNSGLRISYYQGFVEIPIHTIVNLMPGDYTRG